MKDTHGKDLALQRFRADLPPGALQQLPEPLDSHEAGVSSERKPVRGRRRPVIPILLQPAAPPPNPERAALLQLRKDGKQPAVPRGDTASVKTDEQGLAEGGEEQVLCRPELCANVCVPHARPGRGDSAGDRHSPKAPPDGLSFPVGA